MDAANVLVMKLRIKPGDTWIRASVLVLILAVFLALRIRNFNQILTWDEAQFALVVRSFSLGLKDQYSLLVNSHPPGYLLLCTLLLKYLNLGMFWYGAISLLFASGSLFLTYLLAKRLFNERTAFFAAFFFAVMPAATVMDSWVKQDSMATFFILSTIYLFLKKKYVLSGLALGVGLLSKETAIFALPVLAAYSLLTRDWAKIRGSIVTGAIGAFLSFWWFLWIATNTGAFWGFFRGNTPEAVMFAQPWHYYLTGIKSDIGWVLLVMLALGIGASLYRGVKNDRSYLLPILWLVSVYAVTSLSVGKPYWMITSAFPAIALLSAFGLDFAVSALKKVPSPEAVKKYSGYICAAVVMSVCLYTAISTNYASYNEGRFATYWKQSVFSKADGDFLRTHTKKGDLVYTLFEFGRDPVLTFYMGESDYRPMFPSILESPQSLAESCLQEKGTIYLYIRRTLDNRDATDRIARFLEQFGAKVPYRILKDDPWSVIIRVESPGKGGRTERVNDFNDTCACLLNLL